jgi:hypothetical protein
MRMSRFAAAIITLPITVPALLLAGCGGDAPSAPPATTTVTTTATVTATPTPETVTSIATTDVQAPETPGSEEQSPTSDETPSGLDDGPIIGWSDSAGHWISAETAIRALGAGIPRGGDVPDYLRCGTICGELPTSGEVQTARACKDGALTAEECSGIDVDGILAAADGG